MALAWRGLADPGTVRAVAGLLRRATPVMALMMMEWAIMLLVAGMELVCFCILEKSRVEESILGEAILGS